MLADSGLRPRPVRAGLGLLAVAMIVAGCNSSTQPGTTSGTTTSPPPAHTSPSPAPGPTLPGANPTATPIPQSAVPGATAPPIAACRSQRCRIAHSAQLANGYRLVVWAVPGDAAHPALQLRRGAQSIAWLDLLRGEGIGSTLTCDATAPTPNCVLIAPVGLHSAIGEMILLPAGRLVDTGADVVATTPRIAAADLDHDGYLDAAARDSDYRPNFAQGHLFDRTYRYEPGQRRFLSTGCTPLLRDPRHAAAPARLQTGHCPAI